MVQVTTGDIFKSKSQTLVNTVNCVGVMGKGIALEFKKRFPDMYEDYFKRCELGRVKLGEPYLYRRLIEPWIINFPTKEHWRSISRIEDIIEGLKYIERHYKEGGITSLAVPPLGCGQGQLDWRIVGRTLYRYLRRLDIPVTLYAPYGTPQKELQLSFLEGDQAAEGDIFATDENRLEPSWVAVVKILEQVENEWYHWQVGRTMFQKIAYFATEVGIPTGLQYRRGSFGPYAQELKKNITRLVNNGLIQEERLGRMFAVKVGSTFSDAYQAFQPTIEQWQSAIDRIADLFVRMQTKEAELAATVHFAAKSIHKDGSEKPTEADVLNEVMNWKQRRRPPLSADEVAITIRGLNMLNWLNVRSSPELPINEEVHLDV